MSLSKTIMYLKKAKEYIKYNYYFKKNVFQSSAILLREGGLLRPKHVAEFNKLVYTRYLTRLEAAEMRFLRSVKGYTRLDKIRSEIIRKNKRSLEYKT